MTRFLELPNAQRRAIDIVRQVAVEKECRPFLVGGPVRDLLLGRHSIDVDLTLEDGSSVLARALAKRVDGRVRSFPQFLTYKVTADGLPEIDITTARKEKYRAPGALPTVMAGKLKDDLLRRDFSINAIAVDLLDGTVHDPTNGQRDLGERIVRVLHDNSFVDDPTRAFRAIRLAARLGFDLDVHTSELMRLAIASGVLGMISRERVWREMFLAMDEEEAPIVLLALYAHGALSALLGDDIQAPNVSELDKVRQRVLGDPDLDRYVLYTGVLLRDSDASVLRLEGSGFSQKRARSVLQIARDLGKFEKALGDAVTDRQRFRLMKTATPEMLTLVIADRPDEEARVARFHEFQKFKLPLRGNELEVPGGPHVARALERTREAVFTGEIPAHEAQSFARDMALKYLHRAEQSEHK